MRARLRAVLLWTSGGLSAAIIVFLLSAWIGSSIPRNGDWTEPEHGIELMVETNGIHTAIVMPLVNEHKDWREDFPASDLPAPNKPYTHVSVSWGEREVFLNTPTWSDITLPTIIEAAMGGDGLLHTAHYIRPAPSHVHRTLRVRPEEYARLVAAIEAQVLPPEERKVHRGYASYDVFYDAPGTYHIGNSCNQWTSDMLAEAGIRAPLWSPMAGGVMKWFVYP